MPLKVEMHEFHARLNTAIDLLMEAIETGLMSDAKSAVHALAARAEHLNVRVDEFAVVRSYLNGARLALSAGCEPQERAAGALRELVPLRHYLLERFGKD